MNPIQITHIDTGLYPHGIIVHGEDPAGACCQARLNFYTVKGNLACDFRQMQSMAGVDQSIHIWLDLVSSPKPLVAMFGSTWRVTGISPAPAPEKAPQAECAA